MWSFISTAKSILGLENEADEAGAEAGGHAQGVQEEHEAGERGIEAEEMEGNEEEEEEVEEAYSSSDSEEELLTYGEVRPREERDPKEAKNRVQKYLRELQNTIQSTRKANVKRLREMREAREKKAENNQRRAKYQQRVEQDSTQRMKWIDRSNLMNLIKEQLYLWEKETTAFDVDRLDSVLRNKLLTDAEISARSGDEDFRQAAKESVEKAREFGDDLQKRTLDLERMLQGAAGENFDVQGAVGMKNELQEVLDRYPDLKQAVQNRSQSQAFGLTAKRVQKALDAVKHAEAEERNAAERAIQAKDMARQAEMERQLAAIKAAHQAGVKREEERESGTVSQETAVYVPDLENVKEGAGVGAPGEEEGQILVDSLTASAPEFDIHVALLKILRWATEHVQKQPSTTPVAGALAVKLREQPRNRKMRQILRALVASQYPLCAPKLGEDYDTDDSKLHHALNVMTLYAQVQRADTDAWGDDALAWLHRAATILAVLSKRWEEAQGMGAGLAEESEAETVSTHFCHMTRAIQAFLVENFQVVQAQDPRRCKDILARINKLRPPMGGSSDASMYFLQLTDKYLVTPQTIADAALMSVITRQADFDMLNASLKLALANADPGDHKKIHPKFDDLDCAHCKLYCVLRRPMDLSFTLRAPIIFGGIAHVDDHNRRGAIKTLVNDCSARLKRAQELGNTYYNYCLSSLFVQLKKLAFRYDDKLTEDNKRSTQSGAEFLRYLSKGFPDAMGYARGRLMRDCPVMIPDFEKVHQASEDLKSRTAANVTLEDRWAHHRMNLFRVMLCTLKIEAELLETGIPADATDAEGLLFKLPNAWVWLSQVLNEYHKPEYNSTDNPIPDIMFEAVCELVKIDILDLFEKTYGQDIRKQLARMIKMNIFEKGRPELQKLTLGTALKKQLEKDLG